MSVWAWLILIVVTHGAAGVGGYKLGRADMLERAVAAETARDNAVESLIRIKSESKSKVDEANQRNSERERWIASVIQTVQADAAFDVDLARRRAADTSRRLRDSAACLGEPSGAPAIAGTAGATSGVDGAAAPGGVVQRSRADDLSDLAARAESLGKQVTGLQSLVRLYRDSCNGVF